MNAQSGPKAKRTAKQEKALNSAEAKLKKKGVTKKSLGSKIRDALRGNA